MTDKNIHTRLEEVFGEIKQSPFNEKYKKWKRNLWWKRYWNKVLLFWLEIKCK